MNNFKWFIDLNNEKEKEPDWFIEDDQIVKVTYEELIFIYNHCEKELKDTIDTAGILTTKTTTLLTVTVGLLAALIGYSISRWDRSPVMDSFMISAIEGCFYLFILAFFLSLNIIPRTYYALGGDPKKFFSVPLFKYKNPKTRLKIFYINEIESYRRRTNMNLEVNRERQLVYSVCYIGLVFTPAVFIATYLFAEM